MWRNNLSGSQTSIETVRKNKLTNILTKIMYFEGVYLPSLRGNCTLQTQKNLPKGHICAVKVIQLITVCISKRLSTNFYH